MCHIGLFSIHLCVTLVHTKEGVADRFINNIRNCLAEIMKDPHAACTGQVNVSVCVCVCVCAYIYIYIYMCVCMYIHTPTHTHTDISR